MPKTSRRRIDRTRVDASPEACVAVGRILIRLGCKAEAIAGLIQAESRSPIIEELLRIFAESRARREK